MEAARNFTSGNVSAITNVIYLVAVVFVIYFVYKFFLVKDGSELDFLTMKASATKLQSFVITEGGKLPAIRSGGDYAISMWLYITSWEYKSGQTKGVFTIADSNNPSNFLMTGMLYPNEPKMMIRVFNKGENTPAGTPRPTDYTSVSAVTQLLSGSVNASMFQTTIDFPQCDIQDIDLQRWINLTICVNGRTVDVYMDGKLARSCVLPGLPIASDDGKQTLNICPGGGFGGYISNVRFFGSSLTPDRIYSIYQAGPEAGSANFVDFLLSKVGINLSGVKGTLGAV